jgi:hypothetical protein
LKTPLFSHPRVFEGPNLWERAIKGYLLNMTFSRVIFIFGR